MSLFIKSILPKQSHLVSRSINVMKTYFSSQSSNGSKEPLLPSMIGIILESNLSTKQKELLLLGCVGNENIQKELEMEKETKILEIRLRDKEIQRLEKEKEVAVLHKLPMSNY